MTSPWCHKKRNNEEEKICPSNLHLDTFTMLSGLNVMPAGEGGLSRFGQYLEGIWSDLTKTQGSGRAYIVCSKLREW